MALRPGETIFHHHWGGIQGFLTLAMFNKPYKLGAIVLTKSTGHAANGEIAFEMLETLIPAIPDTRIIPEPTKPTPIPQAYSRISAKYRCAARGAWLLFVSRARQYP